VTQPPATSSPGRPPPGRVFDANDLRSGSLIGKLVARLLDDPQWLFGLARRFWPISRIPFTKWVLVWRWEDVREVLEHDREFPVPFGKKVIELNGGPNFLLGMADDPVYWRYQEQVMRAFSFDDVATVVAPLSGRLASEIINGCTDGRLDAVQDFITRVPTLICKSYYGFDLSQDAGSLVEFGHWAIAMSTYMFGDPTDNPSYRKAALAAGDRVRAMVDRSIRDGKSALSGPDSARSDTVLARLIEMQRKGAEGLTDEVIRAYLIGMVAGFVPTNTMAAGNILEMLLRRPDFMAKAQAAARAGDDDLLERCLFEAMRFKPLNPGPFRDCGEDYTIAKGTPRATFVKAGSRMLASTQSAMFDERQVERPSDFDPGRPASDSMLFGHGLHWCVGAFIARVQITQTLKALLLLKGLRRAGGMDGQLQLLGPFPEHLFVEFDR
jgi:cytochrome P450